MIIKVNKKEFFCNLVYILFGINAMLQYFAFLPIRISNVFFVILGIISLTFIVLSFKGKMLFRYFLFLLIYIAGGIISYIWNGNADLVEMLWPVAFMGIGALFVFFNVSFKITNFMYFFFCALCLGLIYLKGGVDNLTGNSSRNSISVYILLFLSLNMIQAYKSACSLSILYAVVAVITCLAAIGRSGIITAVLLMVMFFLVDFEKGVSNFKNIKIMIGASVIIAIAYIGINYFFPEIINDAVVNFEWRGLESKRTLIWLDYIKKVCSSIANIVFGAEISGTRLLNFYSSNLHNSFLMLHAKYGIIGLSIVLISLIRAGVRMLKERNMYLFVPLVSIFFRMNFDYTNFNGILDTVIIAFFMYAWSGDKFFIGAKVYD